MTDSKPSALSKFFAYGSQPTKTTFPELSKIIIWLRFLLAVSYGAWIIYNGAGKSGDIIFAFNVVTFIPVIYCQVVLQANIDSYGMDILFGGMINSYALFLLIWIYMYTLEHEADEKILSSALVNAVAKAASSAATGAAETADDFGVPDDGPIVEETEF